MTDRAPSLVEFPKKRELLWVFTALFVLISFVKDLAAVEYDDLWVVELEAELGDSPEEVLLKELEDLIEEADITRQSKSDYKNSGHYQLALISIRDRILKNFVDLSLTQVIEPELDFDEDDDIIEAAIFLRSLLDTFDCFLPLPDSQDYAKAYQHSFESIELCLSQALTAARSRFRSFQIAAESTHQPDRDEAVRYTSLRNAIDSQFDRLTAYGIFLPALNAESFLHQSRTDEQIRFFLEKPILQSIQDILLRLDRSSYSPIEEDSRFWTYLNPVFEELRQLALWGSPGRNTKEIERQLDQLLLKSDRFVRDAKERAAARSRDGL
ncbi:MAG: hypothetical protein EA369_09855 [Bradymonadales bacterium]|nr:MAG: hypothetical protein EA369_09855 [Bradymonadales bacterium]